MQDIKKFCACSWKFVLLLIVCACVRVSLCACALLVLFCGEAWSQGWWVPPFVSRRVRGVVVSCGLSCAVAVWVSPSPVSSLPLPPPRAWPVNLCREDQWCIRGPSQFSSSLAGPAANRFNSDHDLSLSCLSVCFAQCFPKFSEANKFESLTHNGNPPKPHGDYSMKSFSVLFANPCV